MYTGKLIHCARVPRLVQGSCCMFLGQSHHFCQHQHRYQLENLNANFHSNKQTYNAAKPHKIGFSFPPKFKMCKLENYDNEACLDE